MKLQSGILQKSLQLLSRSEIRRMEHDTIFVHIDTPRLPYTEISRTGVRVDSNGSESVKSAIYSRNRTLLSTKILDVCGAT